MENNFINLASLTTFQMSLIAGAGSLSTYLKIFDKSDVSGLRDLISVLLVPVFILTHVIEGFVLTDYYLWVAAVIGTTLITIFSHRQFSDVKLLQIIVIDSFKRVIGETSDLSQNTYNTDYWNRAMNFIIVCYLTENIVLKLMSILSAPGTDEDEIEKANQYTELTGDDTTEDHQLPSGLSGATPMQKLAAFFDASLIAFILGLVLSNLPFIRDALLEESNIMNETVFVSCVLIAKTVKVMVLFVFGSHLFLFEMEVFSATRLLSLIKVITIAILVAVVGQYVIFYVLFSTYHYLVDPVITIMLMFLFAEPASLGLVAYLDTNEDEEGHPQHEGKTHLLQHVAGLTIFTLSNAFFLFLMWDYYVTNALDEPIAS